MSTKILLDAIQAVITDCYYAGEHEEDAVAVSIGNAFETFKQEIIMRLDEAANDGSQSLAETDPR